VQITTGDYFFAAPYIYFRSSDATVDDACSGVEVSLLYFHPLIITINPFFNIAITVVSNASA